MPPTGFHRILLKVPTHVCFVKPALGDNGLCPDVMESGESLHSARTDYSTLPELSLQATIPS
jgi:hypothetical protein